MVTAGGPGRRAVLHGGAALGVGLLGAGSALTGCQAEPEPEPPSPDEVALQATIADKESLVQRYLLLRGAEPGLARTLDLLVADHRAHLAELRLRLPGRGTASPSPNAGQDGEGGGTPTPSRSPSQRPPSLETLRAAEAAAAAARIRRLAGVSTPVAQLLTSIGACEAVHADHLGEAAR
ncbi:MAG: hypothetical protein GEV11_08255 [Streptosporangiales bacterium]|nr:hypothetical protein [Streptosporangiales bacterium]